jgi:hypothetical protein
MWNSERLLLITVHCYDLNGRDTDRQLFDVGFVSLCKSLICILFREFATQHCSLEGCDFFYIDVGGGSLRKSLTYMLFRTFATHHCSPVVPDSPLGPQSSSLA